jgi:hypothetical protein
MKRITLVFLAFLSIYDTFPQGLILDTAKFSSGIQMEVLRGELPISYSLKKYLPASYPQNGSTCVAMAFCYGRSILMAKNNNITNKESITKLCSFSPWFIYYRNKFSDDVSCSTGLNIEAVCSDILTTGMAKLESVEYPTYYPFTGVGLCQISSWAYYPPNISNDVKSAKQYKLTEIYRVKNIEQLKSAISLGMPVVLCMAPIPPSFEHCVSDLFQPKPNEKGSPTAHAILAVAYDDLKYGGAIQIYNSWGDEWGNKGFTWIKYSDALIWIKAGYAMYSENNATGTALSFDDSTSIKQPQNEIIKIFGIPGKKGISYSNKQYSKLFNESYTEKKKTVIKKENKK